MFSETHIELEPGYQYTPNDSLLDRCMLGASVGMLAGLLMDVARRLV
jgi:hypothetical protein